MLSVWSVAVDAKRCPLEYTRRTGAQRAVVAAVGKKYLVGDDGIRGVGTTWALPDSDTCELVTLVKRGVPIADLLSGIGRQAPSRTEVGTPQGGARLHDLQAARVLEVLFADFTTRLVNRIVLEGRGGGEDDGVVVCIEGPPTDRQLVYLANLYMRRDEATCVAFITTSAAHLLSNLRVDGRLSPDLHELSRKDVAGDVLTRPYNPWPSGLARTYFLLPERLSPPVRDAVPLRIDILSQDYTEEQLRRVSRRVVMAVGASGAVAVRKVMSKPAEAVFVPLEEARRDLQQRLELCATRIFEVGGQS